MIIEEFLSLPPSIEFEGITFHLRLVNDGPCAVLGYIIEGVSDDSPHKATFDLHGGWLNTLAGKEDPPFQNFLKGYQDIEDDRDLIWAMRSLWLWCKEHSFVIQKI